MTVNRTCVLLLAVGAAGGCTAYSTLTPAVIDCSVENAYQFDPTAVPLGNVYTAGDNTPGSTVTAASQTIPDGALCNNTTTALHIQASHNNDWGDLVGFYSFGPRDDSAYSGVSFWGRAPGSSNKSFTLALDDANTYGTSTPDAGTYCTNYNMDGGVNNPTMTVYDPLTNMPIGGVSTAAPPPNACGNSYSTVIAVTTDWRFYTVPFTQLKQAAMPNRVPNADLMQVGNVPGSALLSNLLMNMVFRMPKEADTDLWIGELSFYRNKAPGTVGDGGVDGP
jgi:hypothetical protein